MSKKGRLIFGAIVLVLIVAAIAIILTTTLNGGAKEIYATQFNEYVANAQFVDKDGKFKGEDKLPQGYTLDGAIIKNESGKDVYKVKDDKKVVNADEKEAPIIVIWKLEFNSYERKGYTYNAETDKYTLAYYCYGPSQYGSDGEEYVNYLQQIGVEGKWSNPNAGSWVSTAFSVL